jgi:hypothetical protein
MNNNHINRTDIDVSGLMARFRKYKEVLANTDKHRSHWQEFAKPLIIDFLKKVVKESELPRAEVIVRDNVENLEVVALDLGRSASGISEKMEDTGIKRMMVKTNGSLIYQQLFNGKIMVMAVRPHIEGYGQPLPPLNLEILRPDEVTAEQILKHIEVFLQNITDWEDFDDEEQRSSSMGFNPIGFKTEKEEH